MTVESDILKKLESIKKRNKGIKGTKGNQER
jgi:hypothetical protein